MPLFTTPDGRYTVAWETAGEGDGNSVIYDRGADLAIPWPGAPVWDRFSHEAGLGTGAPVVPPPVNPTSPVPAPVTPPPEPATLPGGLRIIQVTDASDGEFVPRMYSYWPNAWVAGTRAFVFAGHADNHPRFFDVNLATGHVDRLGSLIGFTGTSEGWYWDAAGWVYLLEGPRLRRVSPLGGGETQTIFDISDSHPGCMLWQAHSSDNGQVHSATVKQIVQDGAYPAIGTVVYRIGREDYFPAQGSLDESQIDATGTYLIIKENDDNRVINLSTRHTQIIRDEDGAVGHSDCGPMFVVGEDNIYGACVRWDLNAPLTPGRRVELLKTWGLGHVSVRGNRCLRSYSGGLSLIALDGSGETPLVSMNVPEDYDHQLKANLDPTGRVATYMLDTGGRFDVFLAVLP